MLLDEVASVLDVVLVELDEELALVVPVEDCSADRTVLRASSSCVISVALLELVEVLLLVVLLVVLVDVVVLLSELSVASASSVEAVEVELDEELAPGGGPMWPPGGGPPAPCVPPIPELDDDDEEEDEDDDVAEPPWVINWPSRAAKALLADVAPLASRLDVLVEDEAVEVLVLSDDVLSSRAPMDMAELC